MDQQKFIDWEGFITLITSIKDIKRDDKNYLEPIMDGIHTNHTIHTKNLSIANERDSQELSVIINWITIMLEEGHIKPGQPEVGREIGWPIRRHFRNSLYVDFALWCSKNLFRDAPLATRFYPLLDQLLIRVDEFYEFPPLEECREKFIKLLKVIEEEPWIF